MIVLMFNYKYYNNDKKLYKTIAIKLKVINK